VALGTYQSLVLTYLVIVLGAGLAMRQRAETVSITRLMVKAILTLIIGAAISLVVARLVMASCHMEFDSYGQSFLRPDILLHKPWQSIAAAFNDWGGMYYRHWHRIGMAGTTFLIVLLASLLVCVLLAPKGQRLQRLCWLLVLTALPAALSLVAGKDMPVRTFLGAAAVLCCLLLLAHAACAAVPLLRRVVAVLAVLAAVQGLYVNAVAQARGWAVARHDQALAAAIYGELVRQNGGGGTAQHPLRVHLSGVQPFGADARQGCDFLQRYFPIAPTTTTGASFFLERDAAFWRIVSYMNLLGYTDLEAFVPHPQETADAAYAAMPNWPAPGSVARFGDGFLVKLSSPVEPLFRCGS
jgi:hypothetical protein